MIELLSRMIEFSGNFVPFAMGTAGSRATELGNKTPASPGNGGVHTNSNSTQSAPGGTRKKTRIDVKDVFNNDDDDETGANSKKRKLVPLGKMKGLIFDDDFSMIFSFQDYGDDNKKKKPGEEVGSTTIATTTTTVTTTTTTKINKEDSTKSQEEKRKHIKLLIDKIPTDKTALFGYQLDWAVIDNVSLFVSFFQRIDNQRVLFMYFRL